MYKVWLKLLVLPPQLLKMHAQGYADLAAQAWERHLCTLKNRITLYALSALCWALACVWGGTALLLWAALPVLDPHWSWVLPVLPLSAFALGGVLWAWARSLRSRPVLDEIKAQIELDLLMLQQAQSA
jgi:hypothetical protein